MVHNLKLHSFFILFFYWSSCQLVSRSLVALDVELSSVLLLIKPSPFFNFTIFVRFITRRWLWFRIKNFCPTEISRHQHPSFAIIGFPNESCCGKTHLIWLAFICLFIFFQTLSAQVFRVFGGYILYTFSKLYYTIFLKKIFELFSY